MSTPRADSLTPGIAANRKDWSAVRLLCLYLVHIRPGQGEWLPVGVGPITDEEISSWLGFSAATCARWRRSLERLGFIRTTRAKPRGFTVEIWNMTQTNTQPAAEAIKAEETQAAREDRTADGKTASPLRSWLN